MRGSLGEVQIRRRTAGRSILDEHENDLLEQAINSNSAAIRDLLLGRLLESFCYQVVDQSRRCGVLWPPFSRLPSISADEVVVVGDSECKVDDYCQTVQLPPTYLFSKSHRGTQATIPPCFRKLERFPCYRRDFSAQQKHRCARSTVLENFALYELEMVHIPDSGIIE